MARRLELQALLETILGSRNVYFQEPTSIQMNYPAIVYKFDYESAQFAENKPYQRSKRYMVTIIDKNPDSSIPDMVASLPMSSFSRRFTADKLNHTVYNLYF
jgi:hypothetical protein